VFNSARIKATLEQIQITKHDLANATQTYLSTVEVARVEKKKCLCIGHMLLRFDVPEFVYRSGEIGVSDSLVVLLPGQLRYTKVVFTGPVAGYHTGDRCEVRRSCNRFPSASNNCAAIPARIGSMSCR
jgi:hypothetical protein